MRLAARGDAAKLERWQGRWRAFQVRAGESELGVVANLAWPTVVSNLINFMLSFVNLLFVGHVGDGEVELAAAALAITFTNVTGLSVGIGLLCAIDTLCSQAYGARNYRKVGLIVQRAILIVTLACVPFAAVWLSSEQIFLLCRLPPKLSALAGRYCMLLLPGLWFYMMADVLRRWLQSQAIVKPVIYITICSVLINVVAQYVFVYLLGLGFMGSPLGLALTWACSPFLLLAYILLAGAHRKTWHGWSWECLQGWGEFLRLALPGTLMVCAEWWGFEVTVIAVGLIGEIELAAHTVAFNTLGICYMIPLGMSVAASTRVGNLLGAGDHERAKKAASICVFLTIGAQACAAGLIFVLRNVWGGLYSNDADVVELIARVLPFAALLTLFDGTQGVCGGVLRGAGKQTVGAALNLFAFYCVGLPISLVLGFASPLSFFGIWVGLIIGVVVITVCMLTFILRFLDWHKASVIAREKAGVADTEDVQLHELGTSMHDIEHSSLPNASAYDEDSFVGSNADAQYHVVRTDEGENDSRSDHAQQLAEADEKRGWDADRRATVQQLAGGSTQTTTLQA